MKTFYRIAVSDFNVKGVDEKGTPVDWNLKKGERYLTSAPDAKDHVTVFSGWWIELPLVMFSGEVPFTEGE